MKQVLSSDQLQHRVAQVLEPLVVLQAAARMLVVVRPVGQRLPEQGRVMEADAQRPLKLLERLVGRSFPELRW